MNSSCEEPMTKSFNNAIAMSVLLNINESEEADEKEEEVKLCTPASQLMHISHTPFVVTPPCALPVKKYHEHSQHFPTFAVGITPENECNDNEKGAEHNLTDYKYNNDNEYHNIDNNNINSNNYCHNSYMNEKNKIVKQSNNDNYSYHLNEIRESNEVEGKQVNMPRDKRHEVSECCSEKGNNANRECTEEDETIVESSYREPINVTERNTYNYILPRTNKLGVLSPLSLYNETRVVNSVNRKNECTECGNDVFATLRYNPLTSSAIAPEQASEQNLEHSTKNYKNDKNACLVAEEEQQVECLEKEQQLEFLAKTHNVYKSTTKPRINHILGGNDKNSINDKGNVNRNDSTFIAKKRKDEKILTFTVPQTPTKMPRTVHNTQLLRKLPASLSTSLSKTSQLQIIPHFTTSTTSSESSPTTATATATTIVSTDKTKTKFTSATMAASTTCDDVELLVDNSTRTTINRNTTNYELPLTSARDIAMHKRICPNDNVAPIRFSTNNFVSHTNNSLNEQNCNKYIPSTSRKRPSISISSQLDTLHLSDSQASQLTNETYKRTSFNSNDNNNNNNDSNCNYRGDVRDSSNKRTLPRLEKVEQSTFNKETVFLKQNSAFCTPDDSTNNWENNNDQQTKERVVNEYDICAQTKQQIQSQQRECTCRNVIDSKNFSNLENTQPQRLFSIPRILREYNELKTLGSGGFGSVGLYEEVETGKLVAIKYSSPLTTDYVRKQWIREKIIMQHLNGFPHTLQLLSSWEEYENTDDEYTNSCYAENCIGAEENSVSQTLHSLSRNVPVMYLVLEYCSRGSVATLAEEKRRENVYWSESELLLFLSHTAIGLHAMHSHNFAHVDFKPDNVLITNDGEYKLSDFGCSVLLDENERPRTYLIVKKNKKKAVKKKCKNSRNERNGEVEEEKANKFNECRRGPSGEIKEHKSEQENLVSNLNTETQIAAGTSNKIKESTPTISAFTASPFAYVAKVTTTKAATKATEVANSGDNSKTYCEPEHSPILAANIEEGTLQLHLNDTAKYIQCNNRSIEECSQHENAIFNVTDKFHHNNTIPCKEEEQEEQEELEEGDSNEASDNEQIEIDITSPMRFNWRNYCNTPSSQITNTNTNIFSKLESTPQTSQRFCQQKENKWMQWYREEEEEYEQQQQQQEQQEQEQQRYNQYSEYYTPHNNVLTCKEQLSLTFEQNNNTQMSLASVDEGDCRYLCSDMLNRKEHFKAGDVFSLGMSMYELMCNEPLPCNGEEFLNLRRHLPIEVLRKSGRYSERLLHFIVLMTSDNPHDRPTAEQILYFLHPSPSTMPVISSEKDMLELMRLGVSAFQLPFLASHTCKESVDSKEKLESENLAKLINEKANRSEELLEEKEEHQQQQQWEQQKRYRLALLSLKSSLDASSYLISHTLRELNEKVEQGLLMNSKCNKLISSWWNVPQQELTKMEISQNNEELCSESTTLINGIKSIETTNLSFANKQENENAVSIRALQAKCSSSMQHAPSITHQVCTPITINNQQA